MADGGAPGEAPPGLRRRLLWFAALWAAGVLAVGSVALLIRWVLKPG
ncbi:DUF2474 domain-containing protein [Roseomonas sp. NAR14]|uniref:DUF2474 domain-containing protein n=1 Tax=Roseomonas acroporae TaxID=2937791 RepID=A0A9X1YJ97_9PROT|nr:DUF2474 family protein [Roseomonas acroporae]MCK8787171.1 DUF2474 domain-containing protein [Roseomonas acroporae]